MSLTTHCVIPLHRCKYHSKPSEIPASSHREVQKDSPAHPVRSSVEVRTVPDLVLYSFAFDFGSAAGSVLAGMAVVEACARKDLYQLVHMTHCQIGGLKASLANWCKTDIDFGSMLLPRP